MSVKPVILVIDDDLPILTLMRNVLREFGFDPSTANTRTAAVAAAREKTPELVLLDKNMPGTLPREVVDSLRDDANVDAPILILSGEPLEPHEVRALGAAGAVMKPFDVMELVERIRAFIAVNR